ncbi:MAG: PTS transporter subunit EIIA [Ignavibacteria bacterium]|jgi:PTS system nitrogen regulatory IIA component|nr:PTS transporter subunit EIIA [Ignavibacteria bacterium]MCU7499380.1 PTS transporter subunit EIIA [Ignavibacteria bacterium]MCU7513469.1 PTS transporter subunit EIIA [Ignavibacteria bacterium]MCU7518919.1 PTS transporter subunit EIIA [Ignavibacteria bacterium]MCU7525141.1 PTS transporter subunit EIIA [Ignavibacteria bacterium]
MDLSIKDVANLLMLEKKEIEKLVKKKLIPSQTIQDKVRFNKQAIIEWALLNNKPLNLSDSAQFSEFRFDGLSAILDEESFYPNCGFTEGNYIEEMVRMLRLKEDIDRNVITELLISREKLMSTAIGNGISLPHPRIPIILGREKPLVCFFFPEKPLNIESVDGEAVHTLILLVSQTIKQHLYMLAHLSYLLSKEEFRLALKGRKAAGEVLRLVSELEMQRNKVS